MPFPQNGNLSSFFDNLSSFFLGKWWKKKFSVLFTALQLEYNLVRFGWFSLGGTTLFFPRKAFEGKVAFKKDLGEDYSATRLESVPREYALKRSGSSHCRKGVQFSHVANWQLTIKRLFPHSSQHATLQSETIKN